MIGKHNVAVQMSALMLPGLLYAMPAASALESGANRTTTGSASERSIPEAPIGHRQPTAAEVPKDLPKDPVQERRDRQIDAKLWICRGC